MKLEDIVEREESVQGWAEYRDGFKVLLTFTDRTRLSEIMKAATKVVWERHQRAEVIDDVKAREELAKVIIDWKGFTVGIARKILVLKPEWTSGSDDDTEIPCSPKAKTLLLERVPGFDAFVTEAATDLERLVMDERDVELKNSMPLLRE